MSKTFSIINPFDNSVFHEFDYTVQKELDEMLSKLAQGEQTQKQMPAFARAEILERLAVLLEEHKEELALIITKEMGKPITEARGEIQRAINTTICSANGARSISGEVLDSDGYAPQKGRLGIVKKVPLGTILAITPFNFPVNLALHKIGPAFAAGNAILLKPSPQNNVSGNFLTRLCHEAGMPEQILQCCNPDIPQMEYLITHNQIKAISFTGGVETANKIGAKSGYKKLLMELGGNDPLIIMDDANIEKAVDAAILSRFGTAGQRCTASKRIFVQKRVYLDFKDLLIEKTQKIKIGDPLKEDTFLGPVVSTEAANGIMNRIEQAIKGGATLLCGNKRKGNIIYPTILENVSFESELVSDETFGPVIPLWSFENINEIFPLINRTGFGLQAGIFTDHLPTIKKIYENLDVGAIINNDSSGYREEHFPFGGVNKSGIGREGIRYAIDEMTRSKMLVL